MSAFSIMSGSSGSSGADGKLDLKSIITSLQAAQNKANDVNIARYNKGLGELQTGRESMRQYYAQAGEELQNVGQTAIADIQQGSERALAAGQQSLITSGLTNTTVAANLPRGVEADRRRAMLGAEEQQSIMRSGLFQGQAGAEMGASGNIAQFIASRSDTGPDLGYYSSLIQAASAANTQPVQASIGPAPGMPATNASPFIRPGDPRGGGGGKTISSGAPGAAPGQTGAGGVGSAGSGSAYTVGNVSGSRAAPQGGVYGAGGQALSPIAKAASTFSPFGGNRNLSGRAR